ncbi:unnamed protein product [Rhodiola kirilowii]
MASRVYISGLVASQEQSMSRVVKDFLPFLPGPGVRPEITGSDSLKMKSNQLDDSWRSLDGLLEHNTLLKIDSSIRKPVFINPHENQPDSMLLSHGISENFTRNEEILRVLTSSETQKSGLDLSFPSHKIGVQSPDWQPQAFSHYDLGVLYNDEKPRPSIIIPNCVLNTEKSVIDFVGDLSRNPEIITGSDGHVLYMGLQSEMKDMQSIVEEYYLLRKTHLRRKQSVVPYYFRRASRASQSNTSATSSAKVKSPEKVMNKPSSRKSSNKVLHERPPYANSYSHACEILLSLIMNKGRYEKAMLLSLKKSGPELSELLTKFSVGIAGTGLSVLLTVVAKMACGRLPVSSSKVLSTGIGFVFLWLSWGVNNLRDTVISIGRSSGKSRFDDDAAAMSKVDERINQIFFRAGVLMFMIVLHLS